MRRNRNPANPLFSEPSIKSIVDALPQNCRAEQAALLPEILLFWEKEALLEHFSREGRAATRKRGEKLRAIGAQARNLIGTFVAIDETDFLDVAIRLQMRLAGTSTLDIDLEAALQRSNDGVSWIVDLAEILSDQSHTQEDDHKPQGPDPKSVGSRQKKRRKQLGPMAIQSYLILLDLAAIFELVTGTRPTRRTSIDSSKDYGPFWEFARAVWHAIFDTDHGLSAAVKYWSDEAVFRRKLAESKLLEAATSLGHDLTDQERTAIERPFGAYSSFVANMQFRHRELWEKLTRRAQ